MKHSRATFSPTGNVHVAEEIMRPFAGVIKGRILCGGLREKNTYEVPIAERLSILNISREKWFDRVERLSGITCKKCADRHRRWMDEYEAEHGDQKPLPAGTPELVQVQPDECVLSMAGVCLRTDKVHASSALTVPEKGRWWHCPTHAA